MSLIYSGTYLLICCGMHDGVILTLRDADTSHHPQAAKMEARLSGPYAVVFALLISADAPPAACIRDAMQLMHHHAESSHSELRALYVNTLKKSVTGILLETPGYVPELMAEESQLQIGSFDLDKRINGQDWPVQVLTILKSCLNFSYRTSLHVAQVDDWGVTQYMACCHENLACLA